MRLLGAHTLSYCLSEHLLQTGFDWRFKSLPNRSKHLHANEAHLKPRQWGKHLRAEVFQPVRPFIERNKILRFFSISKSNGNGARHAIIDRRLNGVLLSEYSDLPADIRDLGFTMPNIDNIDAEILGPWPRGSGCNDQPMSCGDFQAQRLIAPREMDCKKNCRNRSERRKPRRERVDESPCVLGRQRNFSDSAPLTPQ